MIRNFLQFSTRFIPAAPSSPLTQKTDVVFLLDASRGLTPEQYIAEKSFIKSLAGRFGLNSHGPRGSVVVYGQNPYTVSSFIEPDFNGRVNNAAFLNTPRRMDKALKQAAMVLTTSGREGRKIVILLTGGRQDPGGKPLNDAIKPLRKLGAQTFVVAIGRNTDRRELAPAVDRPNDIFQIASVRELRSRSRPIAEEIRTKPGKCFPRGLL